MGAAHQSERCKALEEAAHLRIGFAAVREDLAAALAELDQLEQHAPVVKMKPRGARPTLTWSDEEAAPA